MEDNKLTLIGVVEKVLDEDPKARETKNSWLLLSKVLREMGFRIYIEFDRKMPTPESIFRSRRDVLNKRNKYAKDFVPEMGVTFHAPVKKEGQPVNH